VGWGKIYVSAVKSERNRWMEGKSCAELASICDQDPLDFVCDLLAEENLAVTMISFYGSDQVLEKVLGHPQATVGSDGIFGGRPHPRLYGTYPRFLREFVNEKKRMSLPEAIHKITGFPAGVLGLKDRGLLREGYWADLVLMDPLEIADKATYDEPEQYPQGIPYVLVNGEFVVDGDKTTDALPGCTLRK
jgi:N-acyl-D-amino-acid deacylase